MTTGQGDGPGVPTNRGLDWLTSGGPEGPCVLERRDQGPYRHEDEEQDQDHDDEGYEGATAHATALLKLVSIWWLILAAGRGCCQRS